MSQTKPPVMLPRPQTALFSEADADSVTAELSKEEILSDFSWDPKTTPKLPRGTCKWEPVCCPRGGFYQRGIQLLLETGAGLWGPFGNLLHWGCGHKWKLPTGLGELGADNVRVDYSSSDSYGKL